MLWLQAVMAVSSARCRKEGSNKARRHLPAHGTVRHRLSIPVTQPCPENHTATSCHEEWQVAGWGRWAPCPMALPPPSLRSTSHMPSVGVSTLRVGQASCVTIRRDSVCACFVFVVSRARCRYLRHSYGRGSRMAPAWRRENSYMSSRHGHIYVIRAGQQSFIARTAVAIAGEWRRRCYAARDSFMRGSAD